jgi:DNA-binding beta-propeller fold protein YncE
MRFIGGRMRRFAFSLISILAGSVFLAGGAAAAPVTNAPGTYGLVGLATLDPGFHTFAVGPDSNLYGLGFHEEVLKYTTGGALLDSWGGPGRVAGKFDDPQGIATDVAGNVYVADTGNDRIQKFSSTGDFLDQWGTLGADAGEFNGPRGIATHPAGSVYVADTGNDRVQSFTTDGGFLAQWGQGTYEDPIDLTVDADGNVYVLSSPVPKITRSSTTGTGLFSWGAPGSGDGQWGIGTGIDSANGQVFLADRQNDRVQVFLPSGTFLSEFPVGSSSFPIADVAAGQQGRVYTTQGGLPPLSGLRTFKVIANFGHLLKQKLGSLTVGVSTTDLAAEISLKGRAIVRPGGASKRGSKARPRFGLKPKSFTLAANQTRTVKLRFLRRATLAKLARRIQRGKQVSATVTATATEAGGAVTTQELVIGLRR